MRTDGAPHLGLLQFFVARIKSPRLVFHLQQSMFGEVSQLICMFQKTYVTTKTNNLLVFLFSFAALCNQHDLFQQTWMRERWTRVTNTKTSYNQNANQSCTNFFLFERSNFALQSLCQIAQAFQHLRARHGHAVIHMHPHCCKKNNYKHDRLPYL